MINIETGVPLNKARQQDTSAQNYVRGFAWAKERVGMDRADREALLRIPVGDSFMQGVHDALNGVEPKYSAA